MTGGPSPSTSASSVVGRDGYDPRHYAPDVRPFARPAPPAPVYYASGDRRGEHPQKHLAGFAGILQGDCYNGFEPLFDPRTKASPITPAFCFAHARRGFFELADIEKKARDGEKGKPISPIALEAVLRLDALFEIERAINARDPKAWLADVLAHIADLPYAYDEGRGISLRARGRRRLG